MPMLHGKYVFKTDLRFEDYMGLSWQIVRAPMLFLVLAVDLFFCYSVFGRLGKSWPLTIALFIGLFVVLFFLERWYIRWRAKKIYHASSVSSEIVLTLDESGITQVARGGETRLLWKDVLRVSSTKGCHYVFLNRKQAFYFPKRNFKDRDDEHIFCDYIIQNVEPYKVRLR